MPKLDLAVTATLPTDSAAAALVGRVWRPDLGGPAVVALRDGQVVDITAAFPTSRDLCESADPAAALRAAQGETLGSLADILANTPVDSRDPKRPWLLAPLDLQAVKAAGVTFAVSMLERVIEEKARGNPAAAATIREEIGKLIGDDLSKLKPGSPEAMHLKEVLIEAGRLEPVSRGRHRPGRRDLHQGPGDVDGRHRRRRRPPSRLELEQPRAGDRAGRRLRMGASSAPRSATTSTCAMSKAARPCCSARRRTTTRPPPSAPSSASSTRASRSIMSAARP